MAIVANQNNRSLSQYLEIEDTYTAYLVDELGAYLCSKAGEKTEREKIIEQNRGLMKKGKKKDK